MSIRNEFPSKTKQLFHFTFAKKENVTKAFLFNTSIHKECVLTSPASQSQHDCTSFCKRPPGSAERSVLVASRK